jgi:DNA-binding NarL/FixJ family response regulator
VTIRVVLCDDQALVRDGFRMILTAEADLDVVGEAAEGAEAVELSKRLLPHVVLMDVRMRGTNGIDATRRIVASGRREPRPDPHHLRSRRVRVRSSAPRCERLPAEGRQRDAARRRGSRGCRGRCAAGAERDARLLERFASTLPMDDEEGPPSLSSLTGRELEILTLLSSGLSNAELGARLYLSEPTIKTHLSSIFRKLGVRDRVQAVIAAYDAGLVLPAVRTGREGV